MSVETIIREQEVSDKIDDDTITRLGITVFEKLAQESEDVINPIESTATFEIRNSLTRLPDGQTVPDER
ncbi:MAG: hypothetical protein M1554_02900 [Patescibacteria group bacterium]|jgi:hypothetical protein|nr:hypothetical protein [Patescibacteria group bacterium]